MEKTFFTQFSIEELRGVISEAVRVEMQKISISEPKPETEFITRNQTAQILGISLPTLNLWTKQGLIPGYRIASRVRYKKHEIMTALKQINTLKFRRG